MPSGFECLPKLLAMVVELELGKLGVEGEEAKLYASPQMEQSVQQEILGCSCCHLPEM